MYKPHSLFLILFLLVWSLGITTRAQDLTKQASKTKTGQQNPKLTSQEKVLPEAAFTQLPLINILRGFSMNSATCG